MLAAAPSVDPTLTAFDAYGNEVYNLSNSAYLLLAPSFVPAPRLISLSVVSGPAAGGTSVTITGTGFTGAAAVNFGVTAAASFSVSSHTSITAVSPAASPGMVDVTVTTSGGTSAASASDQFTFVAAPSVTHLSPNRGSFNGGSSVTITGANFTGATGVNFSGMPTSFTVNSDTSISAIAPPQNESDVVHVTVVTVGGTSTTSAADLFTYSQVGSVVVSPASGGPTTAVVVSGGGFTFGETVKVTYKTGLLAPNPASVALCTATAAADGTFTCNGAIPSAARAGAAGAHRITAKGTASRVTATAAFTLT